jgi:hypothetical protein
LSAKRVTNSSSLLSAHCQQSEGTDSHNVTVADATVRRQLVVRISDN